MNIPDLFTVSLEWAKRLKEVGWPQYEASLYTWVQKGKDDEDWSESFLELSSICWRMVRVDTFHPKYLCAAPTDEEILRRLPPSINAEDRFWALHCYTANERWFVDYVEHYTQQADTLANAAAAMYCYLAENSLLLE